MEREPHILYTNKKTKSMENFKSATTSRCDTAYEHQSLKLHCPQCRANDCLESHSNLA